MIIYNVTIKVHWAIHDHWLRWMTQEHIPRMLETRCFSGSKILRLLETDEAEGPTYAIQYQASAIEDYQTYIRQHAASLRQEGYEKWGDKTIAFRSVMEVLH